MRNIEGLPVAVVTFELEGTAGLSASFRDIASDSCGCVGSVSSSSVGSGGRVMFGAFQLG